MLTANWEVVLDNSGSMDTTQCAGNDSRMVTGGNAIINFSHKRPQTDNFGLVVFTGSSPYARAAAPLGKDRAKFEQEIHDARARFSTPLGPAIELAYNELLKQLKWQGGYGTYHIVVVTDGEWNQGRDPGPLVKDIVQHSPVQVHTVGFCTGADHRLNMPGWASYTDANNADGINKGLLAVLASESDTYVDSQFVSK